MNNAGVGSAGSSTWSGRDVWTKILDVNLWGVSHAVSLLLAVLTPCACVYDAGDQHAAGLYELDDPSGP